MFSPALKKGTAEFLVLSVIAQAPRHGYEICRLIEIRSGGRIRFLASSLYPVLFRLERRGLIVGRWVEKTGERRRRFYSLTEAGRVALAEQTAVWKAWTLAVNLVAEPTDA